MADENFEPHGTREISGIRIITQAQTQLAQVKKATTQTIVAKSVRRSETTSVKQETERETALVGTLRPRNSIFMETVMMTKRTGFQNQSQIVQSKWYELDGQEQEALINLRDARKKLQHSTKLRRFHPKGGGRARSTGKSIDELKKVTPCFRCGAIGHWEEDCTQPARSRKKIFTSAKEQKEKVVGSGEENLMERDEEVHRTTRLWRSTMMVSKTQTSRVTVPPGYAVLDCGAAKNLCGAKLVALMAQTCARESKRVGDERDTEAIDESYHFRGIGNQIVSSFMKLRVPGSIDGRRSFSPSVTPGDIPPLVGNII